MSSLHNFIALSLTLIFDRHAEVRSTFDPIDCCFRPSVKSALQFFLLISQPKHKLIVGA